MTRYQGPIIDVDIHHRCRSDSEIVEYLPARWRDYVHANPRESFPLTPPSTGVFGLGRSSGARRLDTFGDDGNFPGSDYTMLRTQVLDRFNYVRGILTHDVGATNHANPYFSIALTQALNDWNIDRWLGLDDRLYSVVLVPTAVPEEAAKEIRRVGSHPRMVSVLLAGNAFGRPFGDPVYHPIYEAAAEVGLSIAIHPSGTDGPTGETQMVGGPSTSYMEQVTDYPQPGMHYVSSFIVHGVFEKYPSLHVIIKEFGVAWLPYVMTRLDQNYKLLKLESPFVKILPSEYIRRHMRFSTQPIEASPKRGGTAMLLATVDGIEDLLCFSSDYPHWTMDDPQYVAGVLPADWADKVFFENACRFYRWDPSAVVSEHSGALVEM
jgi:predicted TIM-barrel fold metal-dependent hydrolase